MEMEGCISHSFVSCFRLEPSFNFKKFPIFHLFLEFGFTETDLKVRFQVSRTVIERLQNKIDTVTRSTHLRVVFTEVSKSNWFFISTPYDWLKKWGHFFSQSEVLEIKTNSDSLEHALLRFESASRIF